MYMKLKGEGGTEGTNVVTTKQQLCAQITL